MMSTFHQTPAKNKMSASPQEAPRQDKVSSPQSKMALQWMLQQQEEEVSLPMTGEATRSGQAVAVKNNTMHPPPLQNPVVSVTTPYPSQWNVENQAVTLASPSSYVPPNNTVQHYLAQPAAIAFNDQEMRQRYEQYLHQQQVTLFQQQQQLQAIQQEQQRQGVQSMAYNDAYRLAIQQQQQQQQLLLSETYRNALQRQQLQQQMLIQQQQQQQQQLLLQRQQPPLLPKSSNASSSNNSSRSSLPRTLSNLSSQSTAAQNSSIQSRTSTPLQSQQQQATMKSGVLPTATASKLMTQYFSQGATGSEPILIVDEEDEQQEEKERNAQKNVNSADRMKQGTLTSFLTKPRLPSSSSTPSGGMNSVTSQGQLLPSRVDDLHPLLVTACQEGTRPSPPYSLLKGEKLALDQWFWQELQLLLGEEKEVELSHLLKDIEQEAQDPSLPMPCFCLSECLSLHAFITMHHKFLGLDPRIVSMDLMQLEQCLSSEDGFRYVLIPLLKKCLRDEAFEWKQFNAPHGNAHPVARESDSDTDVTVEEEESEEDAWEEEESVEPVVRYGPVLDKETFGGLFCCYLSRWMNRLVDEEADEDDGKDEEKQQEEQEPKRQRKQQQSSQQNHHHHSLYYYLFTFWKQCHASTLPCSIIMTTAWWLCEVLQSSERFSQYFVRRIQEPLRQVRQQLNGGGPPIVTNSSNNNTSNGKKKKSSNQNSNSLPIQGYDWVSLQSLHQHLSQEERWQPLGMDRWGVRFWKWMACPGLWMECLTRLPFPMQSLWSVDWQEEALETRLSSLQTRGIREASLGAALRQAKESIQKHSQKLEEWFEKNQWTRVNVDAYKVFERVLRDGIDESDEAEHKIETENNNLNMMKNRIENDYYSVLEAQFNGVKELERKLMKPLMNEIVPNVEPEETKQEVDNSEENSNNKSNSDSKSESESSHHSMPSPIECKPRSNQDFIQSMNKLRRFSLRVESRLNQLLSDFEKTTLTVLMRRELRRNCAMAVTVIDWKACFNSFYHLASLVGFKRPHPPKHVWHPLSLQVEKGLSLDGSSLSSFVLVPFRQEGPLMSRKMRHSGQLWHWIVEQEHCLSSWSDLYCYLLLLMQSIQESDEQDLYMDQNCLLCATNKRPTTLIVCDCCEGAWHLQCLQEKQIPEGMWHCPDCQLMHGAVQETVKEDEKQRRGRGRPKKNENVKVSRKRVLSESRSEEEEKQDSTDSEKPLRQSKRLVAVIVDKRTRASRRSSASTGTGSSTQTSVSSSPKLRSTRSTGK